MIPDMGTPLDDDTVAAVWVAFFSGLAFGILGSAIHYLT